MDFEDSIHVAQTEIAQALDLQKSHVFALVAGMAMVAATNSQAAPVPINATMDVSGIGESSFVGSNLNAATSFNFGNVSGNTFIVTGAATNYLGNPNVFNGSAASGGVPLLGTGQGATSLNISSFLPVNSFWTWSSGTSPANRYSFDLLTLVRNPTSSGAMDLFGTGLFHDSANEFTDNTAATIRFTGQSISGNNASWSASWGSPPFTNSVPEPDSLALMGVGMVALLAASRKSSKK